MFITDDKNMMNTERIKSVNTIFKTDTNGKD